MESDSQQNETEVLPATLTYIKRTTASSDQTRKVTIPHPTFPGLHVKTNISLSWAGDVPHLRGVPLFLMNRPLDFEIKIYCGEQLNL